MRRKRRKPPTRERTPSTEQPESYDKRLKAALKGYYGDLAAWLLGQRPESVEELETTQALAQERTSDKFLRLKFKKRPPVLLHVELQLPGDGTMPVRMTEYIAFALRTFLAAAKKGLRPASVVIYLDKGAYREDPGQFDLQGDLDFRLFASYKVVKLWEESPEPILAMESPGLCPFLPLMAGKPEELVVRSMEKIKSTSELIASPKAKRDLLMLLTALATRVIMDTETLKEILSDRELWENNPFFKMLRKEATEKGLEEGRTRGLEEGRAKGKKEGREEGLQESILKVLGARFGEVPEDVLERLRGTRGPERLRALVALAARCPSLASFEKALKRK